MTQPDGLHVEWRRASPSNLETALVRSADGRHWWLHSRVDPEEEARFLVHDVPIAPRTLYVVLGFGLGYHVKALLDRVPDDAHVVVIEPDTDRLSDLARLNPQLGLAAWTDSPRLHLLVCRDPAVLPLRLAASFSTYNALTLQMMPHVPSMAGHPEFYQAVVSNVQEHLPAAAAAHLTGLDSALEHDLWNHWANLPSTWRGGDIDALDDICRSRAVIIVSAGPSLSEALPWLARIEGRALLLATAPTVPVLLASGVTPDVVVTVDPFPENLAHFVPWDGTDLPLVYYQRAFRGILERYRGPVCAFSMREEPPLPLKRDARPSSFFPGGSVAFSALQLAHHMGGNPVVFVGQDFAFADGRTHATGVDYSREVSTDAAPGTPPLLQIPGVNQEPVTTNGLYYSYLLHMQEYLLAWQRQHPDTRHLNASSGAVILGTEHMPLERVLAALPDATVPTPGQALRTAMVAARRPVAPKDAHAFIRRWRTDLERLLADADKGASVEDLFETAAGSSICGHAPAAYARVRYVFETRYAPKGNDARAQFRTRLVEHLRRVADVVARLATEYGC